MSQSIGDQRRSNFLVASWTVQSRSALDIAATVDMLRLNRPWGPCQDPLSAASSKTMCFVSTLL